MKYINKSKKLKSKKLFKSQNLVKSEKKLSKIENLPNFNIKKVESSFLTFDAKIAFNYLWLTFIKTLIFWYFDSKYYIQIETNVFRYVINNKLSQQIFGTSLYEMVIKTNLN